MEKRNPRLVRTGLSATLLIVSGMALAVPPPSSPPVPPSADKAVVLTGWMQVEDFTMANVMVTVEVNGETRASMVTGLDGSFHLVLPADLEAVVRFEKAAHLSKELTVDTHHSTVGDAGRATRHVKFAVALELESKQKGLTYAGPVGAIGFDPQGGCLLVKRDGKLVNAKRKSVMKF